MKIQTPDPDARSSAGADVEIKHPTSDRLSPTAADRLEGRVALAAGREGGERSEVLDRQWSSRIEVEDSPSA